MSKDSYHHGDLKSVILDKAATLVAERFDTTHLASLYAYTQGLSAAASGALGKVPAAVGTFATTAKAQHTEHGAGWNSFLTMNKQGWLTRHADSIGGDGQSARSLDVEIPSDRGLEAVV